MNEVGTVVEAVAVVVGTIVCTVVVGTVVWVAKMVVGTVVWVVAVVVGTVVWVATVVVGTVVWVVVTGIVGTVVGRASEAVTVNDVGGTVCTVVGPSITVGTVVTFSACAYGEREAAAETVTSSDPDTTPIRRNTRIAVIV